MLDAQASACFYKKLHSLLLNFIVQRCQTLTTHIHALSMRPLMIIIIDGRAVGSIGFTFTWPWIHDVDVVGAIIYFIASADHDMAAAIGPAIADYEGTVGIDVADHGIPRRCIAIGSIWHAPMCQDILYAATAAIHGVRLVGVAVPVKVGIAAGVVQAISPIHDLALAGILVIETQ